MSNLNETSRGLRTAIAFLGRRNAGKSSLLNALVGYEQAIVSEIPGTTTDPVSRAVEISPLGPCLVIDTAGIDDEGLLGAKRIEKTREVIKDSDVGLIIIGDGQWTDFEEEILAALAEKHKPVIIVQNKTDRLNHLPGGPGEVQGGAPGSPAIIEAAGVTGWPGGADPGQSLEDIVRQKGLELVRTAATLGTGLPELKEKIRSLKNVEKIEDRSIIGDLVNAGDLVVLVVPIDLGAPKGRLILPQVQTIRDVLDQDATALIVKDRELADTLQRLGSKPDLVITDSQVVLKVAGDVPDDVPLTTFSTVFARFKGDVRHMVMGARAIDQLENGDRVLIAESCNHHALADDIGRVKIPRWIRQYVGRDIQFDIAAGPSFQRLLHDYKLVIQCGGCTITRTAYNNRIEAARQHNVPITNYGLAISHVQGVLPRVIRPFPELKDLAGSN